MDSKKSNKIREIVRLQQLLKKWKKLASSTSASSKCSSTAPTSYNDNPPGNNSSGSSKSIKFLKKTLSFSDNSPASAVHTDVPKGFLAVCVGRELKRYVIPTEFLGHQAFGILLREAEEEFGFQQEGVLKIPCDVMLFEKILKMVEEKRDQFFLHDFDFYAATEQLDHVLDAGCCSPDGSSDFIHSSPHYQLCR